MINGDAICIDNGKFTAVGSVVRGEVNSCDVLIDANGTTACPGLIDSHVHNSFGDYTSKKQAVGFLQSYVHGGTTTCISASEVHVAGQPKDREGARGRGFQVLRELSSGRHARSRRLAPS